MKASIGALVLAAVALAVPSTLPIGAQSGSGTEKPAAPSTEWPTYGHDPGGMRFSPLKQITPENVGQLQVAWTYHMRPPTPATPPAPDADAPAAAAGRGRGRGRGGSGFAASETTPVVVDGIMYISTLETASWRSIRPPVRRSGYFSSPRAIPRRAGSRTGLVTRRRRRRLSSARATPGSIRSTPRRASPTKSSATAAASI